MSKRHAKTQYLNPKVLQVPPTATVPDTIHAIQTLRLRPTLEPMTEGQDRYMEAIRCSDITLCEGLVGTGKTYIATGMAARDILDRRSRRDRLIVVRPIVATEDIGFLPGDVSEKCDPYMQPMYDAFRDFCRDDDEYRVAMESGAIELQPLAFMRGLTFRNAWVILDEAQNATRKQLELLVGRFSHDTKMILCGSSQQCDINGDDPREWQDFIAKLDGGGYQKGTITCTRLGRDDIVRHGLIGEINDRLYPPEHEPTSGVIESPHGGARYGVGQDFDDLDWIDSGDSSGWTAS